MSRVFVLTLALALAQLGFAQEHASPAIGQGLEDSVLLARLQSGGLVLVFRHGKTGADPDIPDVVSPRNTYASAAQRQAAYFDCTRQRILTNEGRDELQDAATAIRRLGIYVTEVYSSPLCRTRETAWLLFGRVTPSDALLGPENPQRQLLAGNTPADGGIRALVTHSTTVRSIVRQPDYPAGELTPEGYGYVLEPRGNGEYDVLAKLGPDDWSRLADRAQR